MTYKTVLVKGADGDLTRFALLGATPFAVFVCREELYDDIVNERRDPPMIGFPVEDVFELDGQPFVPTPEDIRAAA
jgi:hypothetical protein